MYERILKKWRDRIRHLNYVVTLHAEEEMNEDNLSVVDLESAVLNGEIVERQRDRQTREWKYVVNGKSVDGDPVGLVGKLSPTGCLVIITIYRVQP
jgi:hypothetical protein